MIIINIHCLFWILFMIRIGASTCLNPPGLVQGWTIPLFFFWLIKRYVGPILGAAKPKAPPPPALLDNFAIAPYH